MYYLHSEQFLPLLHFNTKRSAQAGEQQGGRKAPLRRQRLPAGSCPASV